MPRRVAEAAVVWQNGNQIRGRGLTMMAHQQAIPMRSLGPGLDNVGRVATVVLVHLAVTYPGIFPFKIP